MPLHMLGIVVFGAGAIMGLIRYNLDLMIVAFIVICLILIAFYYVFLIGRGSYFSQASSEALESIKGSVQTQHLRRMHRACRTLNPSVGGLFPLKQHTVATMYQSSVELTSNFLLM